jgi:hypothetical protein
MSDEREFKIRIVTSADSTGATATTQELNQLTQKSQAYTTAEIEGSRKIALGKHEISAAMRLLGSQFGELGGLAHYLFNPWTAAMGAILVITRAVHSANEALKAALAAMATPIGNMGAAWHEVQMEAIKADKAFAENLEHITAATRVQIAALHAQKEATEKLAEARKHYELSQAQTPEARAAIEERYAASGVRTSAQFSQREINARQTELDNLRLAQHEAEANATRFGGGRSREQVEARLKDLPKELSDLDKQISDLKKVAEDQAPGWKSTVRRMVPGYTGSTFDKANQAAYESTLHTLTTLINLRRAVAGSEEPLTRAGVAFEEQGALKKRIGDLAPEIGQQRATAGLENQTALAVNALSGASAANENLSKILQKIRDETAAGHGVTMQLIADRQAALQWQQDAERRLRSLEGTRKSTAPGL